MDKDIAVAGGGAATTGAAVDNFRLCGSRWHYCGGSLRFQPPMLGTAIRSVEPMHVVPT